VTSRNAGRRLRCSLGRAGVSDQQRLPGYRSSSWAGQPKVA
jgi:hypothetical protein